jgi:hypothetical protein
MRLPRQETEPGEWQEEVNQYGGVQRYRMNGGIKEYEMMVRIDGIEIPQSQLTAYHERKKAAEQARKEAEKNRPAPPPRKNCPFRESMQTDCKREQCALFDGNGCTLARLTAAKATEGLQCPFSKYNYKCRTDCALYKGGCTLTGITTITESEDK